MLGTRNAILQIDPLVAAATPEGRTATDTKLRNIPVYVM